MFLVLFLLFSTAPPARRQKKSRFSSPPSPRLSRHRRPDNPIPRLSKSLGAWQCRRVAVAVSQSVTPARGAVSSSPCSNIHHPHARDADAEAERVPQRPLPPRKLRRSRPAAAAPPPDAAPHAARRPRAHPARRVRGPRAGRGAVWRRAVGRSHHAGADGQGTFLAEDVPKDVPGNIPARILQDVLFLRGRC